MVDDALLARIRGYAHPPERERMRREYPAHAALTDWARAGGLLVAAVTVDGRTFGTPLPDALTPPVFPVGEFMAGVKAGIVKPSGITRERRYGGLRANVVATAKDAEDV